MDKLMIEQIERLAKEHADNFNASMTVSTKTILAIAEAFRALTQRAEAAEEERDRRIRDYRHLVEQHMPRTGDGCEPGWSRVIEANELQAKLEAAESKLAELEKQDNKPSYFLNRIESSDKWGPEVELRIYESKLDASKSQQDHGGGVIELFTRPAPAINLAELVPEEKSTDIDYAYYPLTKARHEGWNACRAEILRRIEEQSK